MNHVATITETAEILEVPRSSLRYAIRQGMIKVKFTAGGTTLVVLKSAHEWYAKNYRHSVTQ